MMDCRQFRTAILSNPHDDRAELKRHAESCGECAQYALQARRFESRLEQALRVDVSGRPAPKATVVPFRSRDPNLGRRASVRRGWLAAAASVLLAAVVAGAVWLASPGSSLAADVVGHMAEEPGAWAVTEVPVPPPMLDTVLKEAKVHLRPSAGLVTYAHSCQFRGHQVPHLVVQADGGPVTVMVLTHEHATRPMHFDEQGYRGIIVPVPGHGSLAVLERGSGSDLHSVEQVAAQVQGAIEWIS